MRPPPVPGPHTVVKKGEEQERHGRRVWSRGVGSLPHLQSLRTKASDAKGKAETQGGPRDAFDRNRFTAANGFG